MRPRLLLLGRSGKLGSALAESLADDFDVVGLSSADFDAADPDAVARALDRAEPEVVVNTVAKVGIDPCEADPQAAFRLNTLYPAQLARLAERDGFRLVHFSTDAVFDDAKGAPLDEHDTPRPLNLYGATKYGGDSQVMALTGRYYLIRIPVLFGPAPALRNPQFVEKMLARAAAGAPLRIADDIVSSPSYNRDIAARVAEMLTGDWSFGLYHVANAGVASLYDLMQAIAIELGLAVPLERGSHRDFPAVGRKNGYTPLCSVRTPPLRDWRDAVRDYAALLRGTPAA